MIGMKRICTSLFIAFLLLFHMAPLAYAAEGRITVTHNNGGTLQVLSAVKMEGNIIYVTDDTKVELIAVPDDGYEVAGVYLNDQSMNISGSGPQNILIAPNGTSVYLRITFVRSENASQYNPNSPSDSLTSPSGETDESVSIFQNPHLRKSLTSRHIFQMLTRSRVPNQGMDNRRTVTQLNLTRHRNPPHQIRMKALPHPFLSVHFPPLTLFLMRFPMRFEMVALAYYQTKRLLRRNVPAATQPF